MFYLDVIEKNNIKLNKLSYLYKKFFKLIDIEYVGDKDIKYGTNVDNLNLKIKINMYKINKRSLKKLDKIIDIILENTVCLSNDLKEKLILKYNDLKKYFEIKGINILDSNILFKIMSLKCIDKIVEKCNLNKEELRIGVLVQNINQDILYNLENLINEYKEVVIITNNENYLERLKNKLYLEKGIILNINNKTLLLKSDIVVNYGMKSSVINEDFIIGKCVYLNYDKDYKGIKILDGIEINDFILDLKNICNIKKYKDFFETLGCRFNKTELYQSLLLKNTRIENILKEIELDGVYIKQFIGRNGSINDKEFIGYGNYVKTNKITNISRKRQIR